MIELYFMSNQVLFIFLSLALLLVALQAFHVALIACSISKKNTGEFLIEVLLLIDIAIISSIPSTIFVNNRNSVIDIGNYDSMLYLLGIPLIISFLILCMKQRKLYLLGAIGVFFTLPCISIMGYKAYSIAFALFLTTLHIRTIHGIIIASDKNIKNLSLRSIRQSLDNLNVGIMFFDKEGYIYLTNNKMKEVMCRFFEKEFMNGNSFWKEICNNPPTDVEKYSILKDIVFRTKHDTWRFSKKSFTISKKEYIELLASDVSEIDKNFLKLEKDEKELLMQQDIITNLTQSVIKLRQEQEYALIQSQIHDVMGQRITALQRILHTKKEEPLSTVTPLLHEMIKSIQNEYKPSFNQNFLELRSYFEKIGLRIVVVGDIPTAPTIAHLFVSIIREAATNAARHANATNLNIAIRVDKTMWHISIENNGEKPVKPIIEGSGIFGIRKRVENLGGKIYIISEPRFSINVSIKKDIHD